MSELSENPEGEIWLVTGERGSGKTELMLAVVAAARALGHGVAGVVCPSPYVNNTKPLIRATLLPGGNSLQLARLRQNPNAEQLGYQFDQAVVDEVNGHLAGIDQTELLLIDELGPLEFERGEGFIAALPLLQRRCFILALVVVRPALLTTAEAMLPAVDRVLWPPHHDNTNQLLTRLQQLSSGRGPGC